MTSKSSRVTIQTALMIACLAIPAMNACDDSAAESAISCSEKGSHHENSAGECVADTVTLCGVAEINCTTNEGWKNGFCVDAQCISTSCSSGYEVIEGKCVARGNAECKETEHLYNNECEADSVENCGSHGNACSQVIGWKAGACTNSQCAVSECAEGYELSEGSCKLSELTALHCESGQHINAEGTECEDDTIENCGMAGFSCAAEYAGWKDGTCTNARCIAVECTEDYEINEGKCLLKPVESLLSCEAGKHINAEGTSCEDDTIENCGMAGFSCSAEYAGWKDGSCTNARCVAVECTEGYEIKEGKCQLKPVEPQLTCEAGKHINAEGTECEADSVENCGKSGFSCAAEYAGWKDGTCTDARCVAVECSVGYEISDGRCQAISDCADNQHWYKGVCENDSNENCGNHGIACDVDAGEACLDKQCVSGCIDGYTNLKYNGESIKAACITSTEDFMKFRAAINEGNNWPSDNDAQVYVLTGNITVTNDVIADPSVGTQAHPFSGTFIGNDNFIVGYYKGAEDNVGIFGYTKGATIDAVNAVTSFADNTKENHGGIIGYAVDTTVKNCSVSGLVQGEHSLGGIIGRTISATVENSTSRATITGRGSNSMVPDGSYCGGIIGYISDNGKATVESSQSDGAIKCGSSVGGLVGHSFNLVINNSFSTASLTATWGDVGGLVGFIATSGTINNSFSSSKIVSGSETIDRPYAGGLVGSTSIGKLTIENCAAFGSISGSTYARQYCGGIIGSSDSSLAVFNNVISLTDIKKAGNAGLFSAYTGAKITVTNAVVSSYFPATKSYFPNGVFDVNTSNTNITAKGFFVWEDMTKRENYTSNVADATKFTYDLENGKALVENKPLVDALNAIIADSWTEYKCQLSSGPENTEEMGEYIIPLPTTMVVPAFCAKM